MGLGENLKVDLKVAPCKRKGRGTVEYRDLVSSNNEEQVSGGRDLSAFREPALNNLELILNKE